MGQVLTWRAFLAPGSLIVHKANIEETFHSGLGSQKKLSWLITALCYESKVLIGALPDNVQQIHHGKCTTIALHLSTFRQFYHHGTT